MKGLIDPNSKLFSILTKMALIMELNIVVLLCCLPVVTAGASLCSMHAVLLKIHRDEEKRVITDFFHAMKSNLKNGTVLWLLFLAYLGFLAVLWNISLQLVPASSAYVLYGLLVAAVVGILYLDWAMILQSRYVYTVTQCLKNALLAWMQYPGSTFVYLISNGIPILLCLSLQTLPLVIMLGIALPHFISTTLYSRVFDQMEGVPPQLPKR